MFRTNHLLSAGPSGTPRTCRTTGRLRTKGKTILHVYYLMYMYILFCEIIFRNSLVQSQSTHIWFLMTGCNILYCGTKLKARGLYWMANVLVIWQVTLVILLAQTGMNIITWEVVLQVEHQLFNFPAFLRLWISYLYYLSYNTCTCFLFLSLCSGYNWTGGKKRTERRGCECFALGLCTQFQTAFN